MVWSRSQASRTTRDLIAGLARIVRDVGAKEMAVPDLDWWTSFAKFGITRVLEP